MEKQNGKNPANSYREKRRDKEIKLRDKIKNIAKEYRESPEKIADFLSFSESFYKYSPRNVMLIHEQNPGAVLCKSFNAWKKEGASVLKGEKGAQIFVPAPVTLINTENGEKPLSMLDAEEKAAYEGGLLSSRVIKAFRIGTVFDIAQTDFPKDKYPELLGIGESSSSHHELFERLKLFSEEVLDCNVRIESLHGVGSRGRYVPSFNCININHVLEDTAKLSTLTHEIGHALLHRDMPDYSTARKEFEADCVSIMLDTHIGLDIPDSRKAHLSDHYRKLEDELEDGKIDIDDIFSDVFSVYHSYIERIDSYLNMEKPEKSKEKTFDAASSNDLAMPPKNRKIKVADLEI